MILGLLALEFCWPLVGSGPLYKEGSEFILNNCSKYWWTNVLLIANWYPSIEKCAPQLFYSAVDYQLYTLGLVAIYLFHRQPKAGILYSSAIMIISAFITGYVAHKLKVIPNFVARDANVDERMMFMDYIHLPTYTHAPYYFMGLLIGFKSITRTTIHISQSLREVLTRLCYTCSLLALLGPVLHNTFQILPEGAVPYYIVFQKVFYVMALFPLLLPVGQGWYKWRKRLTINEVTALLLWICQEMRQS